MYSLASSTPTPYASILSSASVATHAIEPASRLADAFKMSAAGCLCVDSTSAIQIAAMSMQHESRFVGLPFMMANAAANETRSPQSEQTTLGASTPPSA